MPGGSRLMRWLSCLKMNVSPWHLRFEESIKWTLLPGPLEASVWSGYRNTAWVINNSTWDNNLKKAYLSSLKFVAFREASQRNSAQMYQLIKKLGNKSWASELCPPLAFKCQNGVNVGQPKTLCLIQETIKLTFFYHPMRYIFRPYISDLGFMFLWCAFLCLCMIYT